MASVDQIVPLLHQMNREQLKEIYNRSKVLAFQNSDEYKRKKAANEADRNSAEAKALARIKAEREKELNSIRNLAAQASYDSGYDNAPAVSNSGSVPKFCGNCGDMRSPGAIKCNACNRFY